MKKALYCCAVAGLVAFAACTSPAENRAEEMEDQAQEATEEMEQAAENTDTTAVIE